MALNLQNRGIEIPAATRACQHADLTVEAGMVGQAIKQKGYTIETPRSEVAKIQVGEQFFLVTKGSVECPAIAGAVFGEELSIKTSNGALKLGAPGAGELKVGRIVALPGTYGQPAGPGGMGSTPAIPTLGLMRVDLDQKDSL